MPIYEFHCDSCERDSEILVRSSRWKGSKCPHCGSTKLSKKLSVFASAVGGGGRGGPGVRGRQGFLRLLLRRRSASALMPEALRPPAARSTASSAVMAPKSRTAQSG